MSMERITRSIDLPSGAKAEVLTKWLFDEYLQVEGANVKMAKNFSLVTGGQAPATAEIDADAMRAATMLALRLGVRKLTGPEGADIEVNDQTIGELDMEDGLALRDAVNAIQTGSKKK